jgi:hypothetical protein
MMGFGRMTMMMHTVLLFFPSSFCIWHYLHGKGRAGWAGMAKIPFRDYRVTRHILEFGEGVHRLLDKSSGVLSRGMFSSRDDQNLPWVSSTVIEPHLGEEGTRIKWYSTLLGQRRQHICLSALPSQHLHQQIISHICIGFHSVSRFSVCQVRTTPCKQPPRAATLSTRPSPIRSP